MKGLDSWQVDSASGLFSYEVVFFQEKKAEENFSEIVSIFVDSFGVFLQTSGCLSLQLRYSLTCYFISSQFSDLLLV